MVTIKLSKKPCFLCGKTTHVVEARFKDGLFSGTLCKDHLFERLEATYGKTAEEKSAVTKPSSP